MPRQSQQSSNIASKGNSLRAIAIAAISAFVIDVLFRLKSPVAGGLVQRASLRTRRNNNNNNQMTPDVADMKQDGFTSQVQFQTQAVPCAPINPAGNPNFKSQSKEDLALLKYFNGLCNGTYIEMGGFDGVRFSNSYAYNKLFHWKGLLVELSPGNYNALIQNRPNELATVHAGVCARQQTLHYVAANVHGNVVGIVEFAPESFQKQWWRRVNMSDSTQVQEIECMPLTKILDEHLGHSYYFDFFSLDVEGSEYKALETLDFTRFGFGIVFVEADEHNELKNMAVRTLLESNGYTYLHQYERSDWFINQNFHMIYNHLVHPQAAAAAAPDA